nr:alpha-amylase family glycosyl hydrolase [Cyanobium sp. LEGE 06143]
MKSVVADPSRYDWQGDRPLKRPRRETVIYELHVRGFTRHPSSGVPAERAGTYAGLIEKIPYLKDLGITAVELLPMFAYDTLDAPPGKSNYWGYAPISLFAPHRGYSSRKDPLGPLDEFRDLVKALHRADIEVILDVVFNHTAEGDERGPSFCFRGLANEAYYLLDPDNFLYTNYSGTGNTLNANNPVVRRMVRHSLRHWVEHMHVDGFRFDLASVLARDETGQPMPLPPLLWDIETDPVLAGTKLIAEAWDAAGLYQVGSFIGDSWQEWNGRFRDDVRRFLKSDPGMVPQAALRALGSPDIYGHKEREAEQSVNFITCHDGFTLADLVSYNTKHNQANGEDNRDGSNDNASWNCGVEGPSNHPAVFALRQRQMRNGLAFLLTSIGTPMLSMGDEVARSQQGNNNPYCQDNDITWFDWDLCMQHADLRRFVKHLITQRLSRRQGSVDHALPSLNELLQSRQIEWHGVNLHQPDWSADSRSFAITVTGEEIGIRLHVMANAYWEPLDFELPTAGGIGNPWRRWIDTWLESPDDITESWGTSLPLTMSHYRVGSRSLAVLLMQLP